MKKNLQASKVKVLITSDTANFWQGNVEMRFDFVDFKSADQLMFQIDF